MSHIRSRPAAGGSAPAYLALTCVGFVASAPALAQDAGEANLPKLGGMTVTDTALDESGYKIDAAASPKYTAPLIDTPKTVIVLPSQVIQETGSTTLAEALRTVPGITFGAGEGGNPQGDRPFIRGFDAQGSTYIDGIRSVGGQSREIFAVEQIEVVKGGDSTMGGRGSAGGSLNLVSKMAHLGTDARADLSYGNADYKRVTVDANYQLGDMAAIRLNGMFHDADVPGRDAINYHRWGISPSAALGLGTPTRAFFNYYHLESDDLPDAGTPFERVPAQVTSADQLRIGPAEVVNGQDVRRENFYGVSNRDFRKTNVDEFLVRFEHDLSDSFTIRNTAKYADVKQQYILTQPDDSQGNVQKGLVWRRVNSRYSDVQSFVDQIDLSGHFDTGSIKHSISAGAEVSWEMSKRGNFAVNTNVTGVNAQRCAPANIAAYNCTSLFTPNPDDPWVNYAADGKTPTPITRSPITATNEATTYALYALDTVTVTDWLLLNLGARYDWYKQGVNSIANGNTTSLTYKDNFFSWQAGVVVKPTQNGSVYASFAKSTTPPGSLVGEGSEGNAIAITTLDQLKAESTNSYEVGTKWAFFDEALGVTAALFRTETKNARTTGPTGLLEYVGNRRIDGVEVGVNGKILPFWNVFAGYTYMDSEVRNAGVGNIANGRPFPNTPKHSFTSWTTFEIAKRFQIGGGAIYNSEQYGSFGASALGVIERYIPSYWRFDATAAVDITDNISLRINANNLTDKKYYDRTYTTHFVSMAPGRSVFGTLSLKY